MSQLWTRDRVSCLWFLGCLFSISVLGLFLVSIWSPNASNTSRESRAVQTLKFVVVVSRHGNRSPLEHIPNDPYPVNNTQFWPYGQGEVTPQGRIQMYNLGVKIRSLYDGFLDPTYNTNDFYASSTAIERSMISGDAFLAGLYPPTHQHPWDKTFPSQLIPLYSNSRDRTLEVEFCRTFLKIRGYTVPKFGDENAAVIAGLNEYLSKYSGANASGIIGFFPTWDTVVCESTEGFTLPSWMEQIFPHPLVDLASKFYIAFVAGTDNLVRLAMGEFYQEMLNIMKSKVEGTLSPDRKMYYYSGHDFTLITLQAILGIPKSSIIGVVRPGSAMIFELHQEPKSKEFFIQVLYIDGSSDNLAPYHLPVPNCSPTCSFNQIVNNTRMFTNTINFKEECQV